VTRGDIVAVVTQGDYAKPRPAVIVQADLFSDIPSLTVLLLTSELRDAPAIRITIQPLPTNGLMTTSQIMVDKITTVATKRIGKPIGRLSDDEMVSIDRALAVFLGLV
jgi:mRNA interferase MazF